MQNSKKNYSLRDSYKNSNEKSLKNISFAD